MHISYIKELDKRMLFVKFQPFSGIATARAARLNLGKKHDLQNQNRPAHSEIGGQRS